MPAPCVTRMKFASSRLGRSRSRASRLPSLCTRRDRPSDRPSRGILDSGCMSALTVYGVAVLSFMMLMYTLEGRGSRFVLGFALGCLLSGVYGCLFGAWPFGLVQAR